MGDSNNNALPKGSLAGEPCRATLLIVPQQLLINHWMREIDKYFKGGLKAIVYHGRARRKLVTGIEHPDVVITTYNTLAREHDNKLLGKGQSPLHDFLWYRIVLDEAHIIRRPETTFHKAVSSLSANSRWCLSGAPIQNSLADLASLLVFLKIRPFHEARTFRHWIGKPFERKETIQRAVQRLTTLLNAICLRRTIERVELPGKKQETPIVEFSSEERAQYERKSSTMQRFIQQQAGEYNEERVFGIFQVYLQLRSLCNHGAYQRELAWVPRDLLDEEAEPVRSISRDDDASIPKIADTTFVMNVPKDVLKRLVLLENFIALYANRFKDSSSVVPLCLSSKMRALLGDVQNGLEQNKSIIFSCWTRTLDLIARHFLEAGIRFERIDGKTKPPQRQAILDSFNNSSRVPVLIMTTGTCAFGFNIQSANRIFIVEPQWNPTVEDQAISRAIRLGQRQQVLVIRYHVKNSIEDDMCTQQANKLKISKMDLRIETISVPQESTATTTR
ncbi:uncharacterized protein N7483_007167 [Penicillium malachiteum]|uniref:uncharacterized protein n=1 Tax=Penicillium malachiteum TaxID=1324776 RepID=UPI002548ED9B|nr:uncharacterized protein N7483_007167 [Penicillium malachiteum]KAJ5725810.1 hypothetical protein N7483_007167 [Penicillium malachiteum]